MICGSFARNDLQLKASYGSPPLCTGVKHFRPTLSIMQKYLRASPVHKVFGSWYLTGTKYFHLIIIIRWERRTQSCWVIQTVQYFDADFMRNCTERWENIFWETSLPVREKRYRIGSGGTIDEKANEWRVKRLQTAKP